MRRLFAGLALALLIASPVAGAGHSPYSIALDSITDGQAAFNVTRSDNFDNNPVVWVHVECDVPTGGAGQPADDAPVIWGLSSSLVGTATLATPGTTCTAWVTVTPWRVKHNDPSVTFVP